MSKAAKTIDARSSGDASEKLLATHRRFGKLCKAAIAEYKRKRRFQNVASVFNEAGRFVALLVADSAVETELLRRALFVEDATGPRSEFRKALNAVRRVYGKERPPDPTGSNPAEWAEYRLRCVLLKAPPTSMSQVSGMRETIERAFCVQAMKGNAEVQMELLRHALEDEPALSESELQAMARAEGIEPKAVRSPAQRSLDSYSALWRDARPSVERVLSRLAKAEPSLERMLGALQKIEEDAPPEGDGCRLLWDVHELRSKAKPSEHRLAAETFFGGAKGKLFGNRLRPMRDAADAMMAWVQKRLDAGVGSVKSTGIQSNRGRPSDTDHEDDKRIYDEWKTGKYKTIAGLAAVLGKDARPVRLAIDRHRQRPKRRAQRRTKSR